MIYVEYLFWSNLWRNYYTNELIHENTGMLLSCLWLQKCLHYIGSEIWFKILLKTLPYYLLSMKKLFNWQSAGFVGFGHLQFSWLKESSINMLVEVCQVFLFSFFLWGSGEVGKGFNISLFHWLLLFCGTWEMFCFVVNPETHSMFLLILLRDFSLNLKKK